MPRKYAGPLRPGERSAKVNKTYTKKLVKATPKTLSATKKLIKGIMLKNVETKYRSYSLAKQELNHNELQGWGLIHATGGLFPSQGNTDASREGDEILTTGVKFRLLLGQKADRPNVTWKIYLLKYNNAVSGDPAVYNNFYHNVSGNGLLDPVQSKKYKVVKSFTINSKGRSMEVGETAKEFTRTMSFWYPMKRKIQFPSDNSQQPSNFPSSLAFSITI